MLRARWLLYVGLVAFASMKVAVGEVHVDSTAPKRAEGEASSDRVVLPESFRVEKVFGRTVQESLGNARRYCENLDPPASLPTAAELKDSLREGRLNPTTEKMDLKHSIWVDNPPALLSLKDGSVTPVMNNGKVQTSRGARTVEGYYACRYRSVRAGEIRIHTGLHARHFLNCGKTGRLASAAELGQLQMDGPIGDTLRRESIFYWTPETESRRTGLLNCAYGPCVVLQRVYIPSTGTLRWAESDERGSYVCLPSRR